MKKVIIFDMDGLMLDTEADYLAALNVYLENKGFQPLTKEAYSICCGSGDLIYFKMIEDHTGTKVENRIEIIDFVEKQRWAWMEQRGVPKKPGLYELITYLKENGYKIIVGSSTEHNTVYKLLKMANVFDLFDEIVCGDMVAHKKPEPDIFLKAVELSGFSKEEALVLEDAKSGITAATRAGIDVICVPDLAYPPKDFEEKCLAVVNNLLEVIPFLERL